MTDAPSHRKGTPQGPKGPFSTTHPTAEVPDHPPARSRVAPEDVVILYVGEAQEAGELPTQRSLAQRLSTSQPTISRTLSRLRASGHLRVHPVMRFAATSSERGYTLTALGSERLAQLRAELRELRWPGSDIQLGDIEATLPGASATSLLAALRAGTAPDEVMAHYRPEDDVRTRRKRRPPNRKNGGLSPALVSPVPSPPPLVGRIPERFRLAQTVRRLKGRSTGGEVVVLVGPAGAGKSRLLQFAEELARRERIRVVAGHMLSGPSLPFSPFEEMLGPRSSDLSATSAPPPAFPSSIASPSSPAPSPTVSGSPAHPASSPTPPFPESSPPSPSPATRGRAISRVRRMLGYLERIETLSRQGPLLLIVDDLERASPSTLQVFQFLATNVPRLERPVLLIAASRDETWIDQGRRTSPSPAKQLLQVLDGLSRSGSARVSVLPIGPLTHQEARALLEASLEDSWIGEEPARQLRGVLERSQGNPLFLLEGVRALQEPVSHPSTGRGSRHPHAAERRTSRSLPVPSVVRRLLVSRMEGLPSKESRVLEMAACLGEEFEAAPLEALAAAVSFPGPEEVPVLLQTLADRWRILRPVGPSRYAFAHVLFLEILQERSPQSARWSSVLAAWWERARPQDSLTIARLYHAAGEVEHGVPWVDTAIEEVMRRQAYENVEGFVRAAHDLLAPRPAALAARIPKDLALATRLWILGGSAGARGVLELVLATSLPPRMRWEAEATLLNTIATLDPGRARRRFLELRAEVQHAGRKSDHLLEGQLLSVEAFLYAQAGRWEECLASAEGSLENLAKVDDWIWTTWAKLSRALALLSLGRWQESLRACREDRVRFRGERYGPFLSLLDNLEGRVHQALRDPKRARRCFEEGLRAARRIGNVSVMSSLLANRAAAELLLGDPKTARATIEELWDLSKKFDLTLHAAWARYRWAQWLFHDDRGEEADRAFEEAKEGFLEIGLEGPALLPQVYQACRDILRGERRAGEAALEKLAPHLDQVDPDERALLPRAALAWLPPVGDAPAKPTRAR